MKPDDLATIDPGGSVLAPVPVYNAQQMVEALTRYRELQRALDRAMPDQIVTIGDRQFRRKGYWRALAVAFNLTVEPLEERREVRGTFRDGRDNFGYLVTYRAVSTNGRAAIGDGSAFAVEKAPRFKCPHAHPTRDRRPRHNPPEACPEFDAEFVWRALPLQATEHNIRAHSHTRAYTRAVSNLVGFAETPAEELTPDDESTGTRARRRTPPPVEQDRAQTIDKDQQAQIFKVSRSTGRTDEALQKWLAHRGIAGTAEIQQANFHDLLDELELDRREESPAK